jgi:hypothetical protein
MSSFLVRVELHDARDDHYVQLHFAMKAEGFRRSLKGPAGEKYTLPPGEYRCKGQFTANEVLEQASFAAETTGRQFAVLVTVVKQQVWRGLVRRT